MLASALNFAIGFFGYPLEGKYQQSITIEAHGVCVLVFGIDGPLMVSPYSSIIHLLLTIRMNFYCLLFLYLNFLP